MVSFLWFVTATLWIAAGVINNNPQFFVVAVLFGLVGVLNLKKR